MIDSIFDFITAFIIFFVALFLYFVIYKTEEANEKKQDEKKQDDEEPIKSIENMKIHCSVVSEHKDFYWNTGLWCCVCAYREECKKYVKRYGKLPNGEEK